MFAISRYSDMAFCKAKFQKALDALDGIAWSRAVNDLRDTLAVIADYEQFGIDAEFALEPREYSVINSHGLEIRRFGEGYLKYAHVGGNFTPEQKFLAFAIYNDEYGNPFEEWTTYEHFLKELKEKVPPDFIDSEFENWYGWLPSRSKDVLDAFGSLVEKHHEYERNKLLQKAHRGVGATAGKAES